MKTITITLHNTDNSGSSLQAYALQHFLLSNGIENEILDYVPEYVSNNGNKLKTFIRKLIFHKDSLNREKKFREFSDKFLIKTSNKYYTYESLLNNYPIANCYITGSDQLWNSMYGCGNDPAYYLGFIKDEPIRKISYAVSLGRENIPKDNLDLVERYTNDFNWISVRENTSVEQLKQVVKNCDIDYVCDPVLLNEQSEYNDIKSEKLLNEKYILVYMAQIPDTKYMNNVISKIKEKYNYKVVLIGSYRNRCECDVQIRDVAPGDFLSLIFNAEYIISNSFHATMFSLIYNKQFLSVLPEKNGARIKEILIYCNLLNNCINLYDTLENVPIIKNYNEVEKKLEKFRKDSQKKLLDNIMRSKTDESQE